MWRVINTTKINGRSRGQVIPYADQRAYTDRLNALFTPAGWTRKYNVHTSANFQRNQDEKCVAKVFVTCELTIYEIGSHSATGEAWADDPNAGTASEAQAFKRAASCFGLGRYLYFFEGVWVDLDEKKRPKWEPQLAGWATPEGWRQGLRPGRTAPATPAEENRRAGIAARGDQEEASLLIGEIESCGKRLGKGLYRGILKSAAWVWQPNEITDIAVLKKVRNEMHAAEEVMQRLEAAGELAGLEALSGILRSSGIRSMDRIESVEVLYKIVLALESKAGQFRD
jgi:hypothetical protein